MRAADASMFRRRRPPVRVGDLQSRRRRSRWCAGEVALAGEVRLPRSAGGGRGRRRLRRRRAPAEDARRAPSTSSSWQTLASATPRRARPPPPRRRSSSPATAAVGVRVDFPHPFGLLPPPDDRWAACELAHAPRRRPRDLAAADATSACARGARARAPLLPARLPLRRRRRRRRELPPLDHARLAPAAHPAAPAALRPSATWWVAAGGRAAEPRARGAWHCAPPIRHGLFDVRAPAARHARRGASASSARHAHAEAASVVVALGSALGAAAHRSSTWCRDPAAAASPRTMRGVQSSPLRIPRGRSAAVAQSVGARCRAPSRAANVSARRASCARRRTSTCRRAAAALGADDVPGRVGDTDVAAAPSPPGWTTTASQRYVASTEVRGLQTRAPSKSFPYRRLPASFRPADTVRCDGSGLGARPRLRSPPPPRGRFFLRAAAGGGGGASAAASAAKSLYSDENTQEMTARSSSERRGGGGDAPGSSAQGCGGGGGGEGRQKSSGGGGGDRQRRQRRAREHAVRPPPARPAHRPAELGVAPTELDRLAAAPPLLLLLLAGRGCKFKFSGGDGAAAAAAAASGAATGEL